MSTLTARGAFFLPRARHAIASEQLAAAETRGEIEDDHRAERIVEFVEQETELSDAENNRFGAAFARAPDAHELHGILADFGKFPAHRAANFAQPYDSTKYKNIRIVVYR